MSETLRMPVHGGDGNSIYALLQTELNSNSLRRNFATFCQTETDPNVSKLMSEYMDKNVVDGSHNPDVTDIEKRCVNMLADLWNSPNPACSPGLSTAGSSEAAMLAGLAMKSRWVQRGRRDRRLEEKPNLVCGGVHACWEKFARYFDVQIRRVPLERNRLVVEASQIVERVDANTIGVVLTLGVATTLAYEPVAAICGALDDYERKYGINIPVHVDAASGGFVAPFIHQKVVWDFRLRRVRSINASGHKFGLSPLGVAWVIWQNEEDLPNDLIFTVDYLGGKVQRFSLNFSRPSGPIVVQYYNLLRLGRDGYRKVVQGCSDRAAFFAKELQAMGDFDVLNSYCDGVPGVCWKLHRDAGNFSLEELSAVLSNKGWRVPAYRLPANLSKITVMRVVIRSSVSWDLVSSSLNEIRNALVILRNRSCR
jgi:glutamate decarboxylase